MESDAFQAWNDYFIFEAKFKKTHSYARSKSPIGLMDFIPN